MTGVALVTGGSRGIGRAVALEAARRGYDVLVGCGRDRQRAEEVASAVGELGSRSRVCVADLCTSAGIEATATAARELGPVSLLVNNAGVTNSGPFAEMDARKWEQTLALNLSAPVWLTQSLTTDLAANHGCVVNVGSTGGIVGSVHSLPYAASKAGLIGVTKTLARMLAPDIRVNLVAPGITDTDLLDGITDAQRRIIVSEQPLARLGSPGEIARAVLDVSAWTYATGQIIIVDGGRVM
jgi:3-oxoacyl-[acyl-carrier protein] reductase